MSTWGTRGPNDYIVLPNETHTTITKVQSPQHPSFQIARDFLLTEEAGYLVPSDHRQPLLQRRWRPDRAAPNHDRFVYSTRTVPLIGREADLEHLTAFLDQPDQMFSWMVLSGSGGMGKSRLALELILSQKSAWWYAGFLNGHHEGPDWTVWQPQLPTLVVMDYAARSQEKTVSLLKGLSEREGIHCLRMPVRVILIDRQPKGQCNWYDELRFELRSDRTSCFDNLELLQPEFVWPIFDYWWEHNCPPTGRPSQSQTLAEFEKLDPEKRPLFAYLMADAITRHGNARQWNQETLLNDIIERDRIRFWKPVAHAVGISNSQFGKEERALVLATMADGLSINFLKRCDDDLLPKWRRDVHPHLFQAITEVADGSIRPIAPDIVGEFFPLDYLLKNPEVAEDLIALAWRYSPFGMRWFVDRCVRDFREHSALGRTYLIWPETKEARQAWSGLVINLINYLGAGNPNLARELYEKLRRLASEHEEETEVRLNRTQAAATLTCELEAWEPDAARDIYHELERLVADHADEHQLKRYKATAIHNLVRKLSAKEPTVACELYEKLKRFAQNHPEEPELRSWQAQAACYLSHALFASDLAAARSLYEELKQLAECHISEPELRDHQAHTACNLTLHLCGDEPVAARELYEDLKHLARNWPNEPEIRRHQAHAADKLTRYLDRIDPAIGCMLYGEIKRLAEDYPDDRELRLSQAAVAYNLAYRFGGEQAIIARVFCEELNKLAEAYPGEPEFTGYQESIAGQSHDG